MSLISLTVVRLSETFITHNMYVCCCRLSFFLSGVLGDADLYVSDRTRSPSFYYDQYEMKSTTCGEDIIDLSSLKRPLYIGMYNVGVAFAGIQLC